jgi:hypothetical protein
MATTTVVNLPLIKEYKTPNEKIGNNVTLCGNRVILGYKYIK